MENREIESSEPKDSPKEKSGCGCLSSLISFALGVALLQILMRLFK